MPEPTKSYGAVFKLALDLIHAIAVALFRDADHTGTRPDSNLLQGTCSRTFRAEILGVNLARYCRHLGFVALSMGQLHRCLLRELEVPE